MAAGIRFCDPILSVVEADVAVLLIRGITRQQRLMGPRALNLVSGMTPQTRDSALEQ